MKFLMLAGLLREQRLSICCPLLRANALRRLFPAAPLVPLKYLFMATNKGSVKKVSLADFETVRKSGLIAIKLDEKKDEELISVRLTDGKQEIMMATHHGFAIRFNEKDVRAWDVLLTACMVLTCVLVMWS
jgi:DNA gyrase/topoisomerase IV subunit A